MQELDFTLIAILHHRLKQLRTGNCGNFLIEGHVGVDADNAAKLFSAGADVLAAGVFCV
jgi:pentose-5-phosphate-3-epimerase